MKHIVIKICCLFAGFIFVQGCTSLLCLSEGYSVKDIKETCVTDEPGTYLDPKCNIAARKAAEYNFNPDSASVGSERLLRIITKNIHSRQEVYIPVEGGSIRVWIYNDERNHNRVQRPVVIYLHGGGFQKGNLETFDFYTSKLAASMDVVLVAVEYRLAPQFSFPVAVNDVYASLVWVSENVLSYGGDPSSIFVMGGSAGGNLAAVLPLVSNDLHGPKIKGQILCYPAVTFLDTEYPSREYFLSNDGKYILTRDFLIKCKNDYLRNLEYESHRFVSPLSAELNFDIPPALIITAQCDPLRDEGRAYAQKLSESGAEVEFHEFEGMIHAFMPLYPILKDGRKAIKIVSQFVESR